MILKVNRKEKTLGFFHRRQRSDNLLNAQARPNPPAIRPTDINASGL
jgi:hypothetical protein